MLNEAPPTLRSVPDTELSQGAALSSNMRLAIVLWTAHRSACGEAIARSPMASPQPTTKRITNPRTATTRL
jgi:hypothetical protein